MTLIGFLLLPLTLLYSLITRIRNHLYNIEYSRSFKFDTKVIAVGNLAVGGTGKTPMIEYLIKLLQERYNVVTLSRGYRRRTKGFRIATDEDNATTIGDEPFQFYSKFKDSIHVTVGEERALAIPQILHEIEDASLILMDDAYQHRSVIPDINILLSDYSKPFYNDYLLPSGRLREARKEAKRADMVVITKCPMDLAGSMKDMIKQRVIKYSGTQTPIFFSTTSYMEPLPIRTGEPPFNNKVLLFSGIANPVPFEEFLRSSYQMIGSVRFPDHHFYTKKDIQNILNKLESFNDNEITLITTEKDAMRMETSIMRQIPDEIPLYYIPIQSQFVEDGKRFDELILDYLDSG